MLQAFCARRSGGGINAFSRFGSGSREYSVEGGGIRLEALFAPLSQGACVKMDEVRAVSATVQLTPDQFQFVRAFWLATAAA